MKMELPAKILSDITVFMKYAKFDPKKNRRENWKELVDRNKAMHLEKFPQLKAEYRGLMIYGISAITPGHINTLKKEVRVPSDLKGMKVRTAPAATDTLYIKVAGGTAVPLSPSDAVPAMKTGQVEAATQLSVFGVATGYDKVGPQITLTRHQHQVGAVVISAQTWSSLSEQEKGWLNAAAPTFLKLRDAIRGAEGALLGKAKKDGATVIELSDAELGQWRALAPKAQEIILDDLGAKARPRWDQINEAKLACAK